MYSNVFEQRTSRRIPTRRCVATVRGGDAGGHRVLDLSSHGTRLELDVPLEVDQELAIELRHAHLPPVAIAAVVRWCITPAGKRPMAGLEFATISAANRRAIRRVLAAESGSCVFAKGNPLPLGFVGRSGEVWSFYDGNATRIAVLQGSSPSYKLTLGRDGPRGTLQEMPVGSFADAVRAAYEAWDFAMDPPMAPEGEPLPATPPGAPTPGAKATGKIKRPTASAPPPPPPPSREAPTETMTRPSKPKLTPAVSPRSAKSSTRRPQRLQGSAVMNGDIPLGYVARVGDGEWALFDPDQEQIGMLIQKAGSFTVFWLGASVEDSFMSLEASNFAMAVAKAFELDGFPRLVSKVIEPRSLITRPASDALVAETRHDPGSRVLHRRRLAGFVYEAEMPNVFLVINREHEQVAIINRMDGALYQVVLMGQSPDDSMEFENQPDLASALAVALELDGRPLVDPPLEAS